MYQLIEAPTHYLVIHGTRINKTLNKQRHTAH